MNKKKQDRLVELYQEKRMEAPGREPTGENDRADTLLALIEKCLKKTDTMIEVGCFKGVSTEMFALNCEFVYGIDPYDKGDTIAQDINGGTETMKWAENVMLKRMRRYNNFFHIDKMSSDAHKLFENNCMDFVYIDGDHRNEAVYEDFKNYLPKVKHDGIIAGHDYYENGVKEVIDYCIGEPECVFGESSFFFRKKNIKEIRAYRK